MNRDVLTTVENIVKKTLSITHFPADFNGDTPLPTLGIDSILLLEIIVCLETELGIEIADESLNDLLLSSINGLVKLVELQKGGGTGS